MAVMAIGDGDWRWRLVMAIGDACSSLFKSVVVRAREPLAFSLAMPTRACATHLAAGAAPDQTYVASEPFADGEVAHNQEDLASEDFLFEDISSLCSDSQSMSQSWMEEDSQSRSTPRPSKKARVLECDRDAYKTREAIALKRKLTDQASKMTELTRQLKALRASPNGHGLDSIVAGKHMTPSTGLLLALKKRLHVLQRDG